MLFFLLVVMFVIAYFIRYGKPSSNANIRAAKAVGSILAISVVFMIILSILSAPFSLQKSVNGLTVPMPIVPNRSADLQILQASIQREPVVAGAYSVYCRIRNNSGNPIQFASFTATFYDKNKRVIGTGVGGCSNIAAKATKTVTIMAMNIANPYTYDIQIDNCM